HPLGSPLRSARHEASAAAAPRLVPHPPLVRPVRAARRRRPQRAPPRVPPPPRRRRLGTHPLAQTLLTRTRGAFFRARRQDAKTPRFATGIFVVGRRCSRWLHRVSQPQKILANLGVLASWRRARRRLLWLIEGVRSMSSASRVWPMWRRPTVMGSLKRQGP